MAYQVAWFEVTGQDGEKLRQFYGGLFGWNINADNPMHYGIVEGADGGIGGGIGESQNGGKTMVPVTEIPNMATIAQLADPEGNVVGVVKNTM